MPVRFLFLLFHIKSAVDVDNISGYVRGKVRGKEKHGVSYVVRRSEASERDRELRVILGYIDLEQSDEIRKESRKPHPDWSSIE